MSKILISLEVPSLGEKYDLFVPDEVAIASLTEIVSQGLFDVSGGKYIISGKEMMMALKPDKLLNPERTLFDYGISDGTPLMII